MLNCLIYGEFLDYGQHNNTYQAMIVHDNDTVRYNISMSVSYSTLNLHRLSTIKNCHVETKRMGGASFYKIDIEIYFATLCTYCLYLPYQLYLLVDTVGSTSSHSSRMVLTSFTSAIYQYLGIKLYTIYIVALLKHCVYKTLVQFETQSFYSV